MDVSRFRRVQRVRRHMQAMSMIAVFVIALFQPTSAIAYELDHAKVTQDEGVFHLQFSTIINAPADYVRRVLTDFAHIYRLNPSIVESEVLPSKRSDETKVRTKVLACASVFCREIERVEIVRILASGDLRADIVPETSEFRSGQAIWKITDMGDKSKLEYEASLEPDFFIPPIIGIAIIGSSLKNEVINTFGRVERIASINAHRDQADSVAIADFFAVEPPPCD